MKKCSWRKNQQEHIDKNEIAAHIKNIREREKENQSKKENFKDQLMNQAFQEIKEHTQYLITGYAKAWLQVQAEEINQQEIGDQDECGWWESETEGRKLTPKTKNHLKNIREMALKEVNESWFILSSKTRLAT